MPSFFITISPPPRTESIVYLYNSDTPIIRRYLNKFSHHWILYPEITLLDSRLHYHGIIDIHDMIKFHKIRQLMTRTLGFIVIKPVKNNKERMTTLIYCMKEWASTRTLLHEPIIYKSLKRHKKIIINNNHLDEGIIKYFK